MTRPRMGALLMVAGWVEHENDEHALAWRKKAVAPAKLKGWAAPVDEPATGGPLERLKVGEVWARAKEAADPIEVVETARGVRFAAAFATVTGRTLWAPALLAAVRRAAGAQGGAWAWSFGGPIFAVDPTGRGAFRTLDEEAEVTATLAEPELARALALAGPEGGATLGSLPPRRGALVATGATRGRAPAPTASSAIARAAPSSARVQSKKLALKAKSAIVGVTQTVSGEVWMASRLAQLMRGRLDAGAWTTTTTDLGVVGWIAATEARLWVGTRDGLRVSEDGGASFGWSGARVGSWSRVLAAAGAHVACCEGAVVRSVDGGQRWTPVLAEGEGALALAVAGELVVAGGIAGRVFVSRDGGASFEHGALGGAAVTGIAVLGEHVFYLRGDRLDRASLARPTEVERVDPKSPRAPQRARVVADHGTVWLAGEYEVVRSRDAGASWERIAEGEHVFHDVLPLGAQHLIATRSDGAALSISG